MGGSDADNASSKILEALNRFAATLGKDSLEVILAVGSGNPHLATLERANDPNAIRVQIVRDACNMPSLMAWADVAIAASGGTALELCYMGLPSLLLIAAENQRKLAEDLDRRGAALNAGETWELQSKTFTDQFRSLLESSSRRESMSKNGRALVDGSGADRVRGALTGRELHLRNARESDCKLLLGWANDPAARTSSFHSTNIQVEEHARWFAERLNDPQSLIYIGEACSQAVGQVRFQFNGNGAVISVGIAPECRGKGWGATLVTQATRALARNRFIDHVDAFVKPETPLLFACFNGADSKTTVQTKWLAILPCAFRGAASGDRMPAEIVIAGRRIGSDFPIYIVAELSANHNQSFEQAVCIVHAAKDAGADAIKLQTYTADTITLPSDMEISASSEALGMAALFTISIGKPSLPGNGSPS